jgi:hypothetical protein
MTNARPYTIAQRLHDLDRIIAEQDASEPGGGWLARAVKERVLANLAALKPPSPAHEIEALLTSGLTGSSLARELWARFATAARADVFAGMAGAVTILAARATLAELDTAVAATEREVA